MCGELPIFEEHIYSDPETRADTRPVSQLDMPRNPQRILLTTLPGEQHTIGMLMVEASFDALRRTCLALGPQTPVPDIQRAMRANQADVLCLPCGVAFPQALCVKILPDLRLRLDRNMNEWVGVPACPKVCWVRGARLDSLTGLATTLSQWRNGITLN